jgi:hypothetical protein
MLNIRSFDKAELRGRRIDRHLNSRKSKRDLKVSALRNIAAKREIPKDAGAAQGGDPPVKRPAPSGAAFSSLLQALERTSPMQLGSPPYQANAAQGGDPPVKRPAPSGAAFSSLLQAMERTSPMQLGSPPYQANAVVAGSPMELGSPSFQVTNAEIETVFSEEPMSAEKGQGDEDSFIDKKCNELKRFYSAAVAGMEEGAILPSMSQTSLLSDDDWNA